MAYNKHSSSKQMAKESSSADALENGLTEDEADELLAEALSINQRLKEELQDHGQYDDTNEQPVQGNNAYGESRKSYDRMPSATGGLSRLQVQFGSRESLSGSLPPIVGSTSGQYSAKAYGARRQYPQQGSHGVYHARLQFNSPDDLTSRPPSQAAQPEQPIRESTSLWNTNPQWTEKFAYT